MQTVIECRGIEKSYRTGFLLRRKHVLKGLDLAVQEGEIFGFIGPNGAGKTTTLRLLVGLMYPDAGEITLLGGSPYRPATRERIGFLPENPYLYEYLTVEEILRSFARFHKLSPARTKNQIEFLLEQLRLRPHANKKISALSKGLKQRTALALALIHDPEVLILDEPMSGLDPLSRWEIREFIRSFRGKKTILFTSHILSDAEILCDRVGFLIDGRMDRVSETRELIQENVQGYEIWLGAEIKPSPPTGEVISINENEWKITCSSADDVHSILHWARENPEVHVRMISPVRRTLDEIFFHLVAQNKGEK